MPEQRCLLQFVLPSMRVMRYPIVYVREVNLRLIQDGRGVLALGDFVRQPGLGVHGHKVQAWIEASGSDRHDGNWPPANVDDVHGAYGHGVILGSIMCFHIANHFQLILYPVAEILPRYSNRRKSGAVRSDD